MHGRRYGTSAARSLKSPHPDERMENAMNVRAAISLAVVLLLGIAPAASAYQGRGHRDYDRRYEKRDDRKDKYRERDHRDHRRNDRYKKRKHWDHGRVRYDGRRDKWRGDYYRPPKGYRHVRDYRIPRGYLPPPGYCRVWYVDRPWGHQPPPGSCYGVAGHGHAWVIVTHEGYVYGSPHYFERHRHVRRPEIVIRGEIRF